MLIAEAISPDEKRELVGRIIASKQFARSGRLSSFLSHICELEIQGRLNELNEREIGHRVFSLPNDYDPSVDGIVRSHASRLRRKLEMYYLREGYDEPIRLVIPRGRYQPQFEWANLPLQSSEPAKIAGDLTSDRLAVLEDPAPENRLLDYQAVTEDNASHLSIFHRLAGIPRALQLLVPTIAIAVMIAALMHHRENQPSTAGSGANSFWDEIFIPHRPTILVPGDSGVVMWQEMKQQNLSLADYISSSSPWRSNKLNSDQDHLLSVLIRRRYTSIVDLDIVQKLSRLAYLRQAEPVLRYARDVRPNDLKGSNVVLIGSSETNPWTQMFQEKLKFVLRKDQHRMAYTIENRQPEGDEPKQWVSDSLVNMQTAYCKVAYLANPSGEGNILLLEGTSMAGTECAWEFASSREKLGHLLEQMKSSTSRSPHFEVLLKTSNLAGDSAESSVVAWRTIY